MELTAGRAAAALALVLAFATACGGEDAGADVCTPAARVCSGDQVLRCRDDGRGYETLQTCAGGFYCWRGECTARTTPGDALVGADTTPATNTDTVTATPPDTTPDTTPDTDTTPATDTTPDTDTAPDTPAPPDVPAADVPETAGPLCGNGLADPGELCDPEAPAGTPAECPTSCPPADGCVTHTLEGAAADCSAFCRTRVIDAVGPEDGCCPEDATHDLDPDCPETCGDGVIQTGERCDPGIQGPAIGACPTGCAPGEGCAVWSFEGAAEECSAHCVLETIDVAGPDDGCCPPGTAVEDDPDCLDSCGDGVLQTHEACDRGIAEGAVGSCPTACAADEPCRRWFLEGDAALCTATCRELVITAFDDDDGCCPEGATPADDEDCAPECGNGRIEEGEECDGGPPPGTTCQDFGFVSTELPICTDGCALDTFPCGGHALVYEKITSVPPLAAARGSYVDVAWFPNGASALVATEGHALLEYDAASGAVSVFAAEPLGGVGVLATLPDRDAILLLGWDGSGDDLAARATLVDGATGAIEPLPDLDVDGVAFVAAALSPEGDEAVLGAVNDLSRPTISYLYHVETTTWTVTNQTAWASQHGLSDVVWARVPRADPRFVVTLEGWSGVDSNSWYLDFGEGVQPNGWPVGFGNTGRGGWRPGGRYLLAAGTSTERIYVFTYTDAVTWDWTGEGNIPGPSTNFVGAYWHPRGHRALVTGRSGGIPRVGRVVEVVPRGADFSAADLREADIPGFTEDPFAADDSAYLHVAAWQPGPCDGGLLVGDDDGTVWSPTFGLLIRFWDEDDPDCAAD